MGFTIGRLLLLSLTLLIFFGVAERVLDRMHMSDKSAMLVLAAILLGSFVNITLYRSDIVTVRMNLGGALVPLGVALYVWVRAGSMKERVRSLLGAVLVTVAIWLMGRLVVDEYSLPLDIIYLYPIAAGLVGYLFGRSRKGAFIAAVLGVLFFDLSHGIYLIINGIPGLVHFGGGGMYDTVVLSGVLAVCLAEFIGETRERMQGGPKNKGNHQSVLQNLRNTGNDIGHGMKEGRYHG
ncbi:MAG: DUF1614 domain-containing protein [Peptococcaceae bacterium]|nr:DUF1614 domain-containing protein [Peptococcaceae bacterium]